MSEDQNDEALHGDVLPPSLERSDSVLPRTSPLAVTNWIHGDPSFLKVRELIDVVDPDLTVTDRKMLDAMLAHASESVCASAGDLGHVPGTRLYAALATDMKRAMGWEGHKGNKDLLDAAKNLQSSVITIGYFAPGDDNLRHMNISLITFSDVPEKQGMVYWKFSAELEKLMSARGERFLVQLKVLAKLTSGYSHRLYQLLCANTDRDTFSWTVSVVDLRNVLNATAQSYDLWSAFERRVLKVALKEINNYAPFKVSHELIADARTRKRTHVKFIVEGPSASLPPPQMEPSFINAEQLALDLGTGENGEPAPLPETINNRIYAPAKDRLREQYGPFPVDELIGLWAEWCIRHKVKVDRPARLFERWLCTMFGDLVIIKEKGGEPNWKDAINRDINTRECIAMYALSNMVAKQRARWLDLAKRKTADISPRAKLAVPDLDVRYFHLWVPLILEEFSKSHPV